MAISLWNGRPGESGISGSHSSPPGRRIPGVELWMFLSQTAGSVRGPPGQMIVGHARTTGSRDRK